jgi:flagellar motor switch protein FliN/FliY
MPGLRILPFSLEGLPHLPRPAVPWTRAVARVRAALPRLLAAEIPRLGRVEVRPSRLAFLVDPDRGGESLALELGGRAARLQVDPALALRLVGAVVGADLHHILRPLTPGERGVLAAEVVALLDSADLASQVRVALHPPPAPDPADLLAVDLKVTAVGTSGVVRLELPPAALPAISVAAPIWSRRGVAARPATVRDLLLTDYFASVELARTELPGLAFASAGAGDAVVFDQPALPGGQDLPWEVELRCGDCVLPARLSADGTLQPRGPLAGHEIEVSMDTERNTVPDPSALSDEAARILASAPVEIVAELGRLRLRGEELVGLLEGGVLSLGPRRPAQIQLRVGGRLWAMGELVAIDEELGVRITELVRER